jgi:hypothetical protein
MIPWKPGLFRPEEIPESVYHADDFGDVPTLSRGVATRIVEQSLKAAHYFHPQLGAHVEEIGEQKQKNLDAGNVNHSLILGSGQAFEIVPGFDDWRTSEAGGKKKAIRRAGKIPLLQKEHDKQKAIVEAVMPGILAIVGRIPPEAEMTALWEETEEIECPTCLGHGRIEDGDADYRKCLDCSGTGIERVDTLARCKTRIDIPMLDFPGATIRGTWGDTVLRPGAWVFDLKGAKDVGPRWERGGDPIGLDIQAYMHVHSLETLIPELAGRVNFADIVFQTYPPWDVVVLPWPDSALDVGKMRFERAVKAWAGAMASGFWPGMGGRPIEVKPWQRERETQFELSEEGEDNGSDA